MSNKKQITPKDVAGLQNVEVELGDLIGSYESLLILNNKPFLIVTGFKIARALKQVTEHVKAFEDLKDKLRNEFAKKTVNEETHQIRYDFGDKEEEVKNRLNDEMDKKVTVNVAKISAAEFGAEAKLEAKILGDLDWLITE